MNPPAIIARIHERLDAVPAGSVPIGIRLGSVAFADTKSYFRAKAYDEGKPAPDNRIRGIPISPDPGLGPDWIAIDCTERHNEQKPAVLKRETLGECTPRELGQAMGLALEGIERFCSDVDHGMADIRSTAKVATQSLAAVAAMVTKSISAPDHPDAHVGKLARAHATLRRLGERLRWQRSQLEHTPSRAQYESLWQNHLAAYDRMRHETDSTRDACRRLRTDRDALRAEVGRLNSLNTELHQRSCCEEWLHGLDYHAENCAVGHETEQFRAEVERLRVELCGLRKRAARTYEDGLLAKQIGDGLFNECEHWHWLAAEAWRWIEYAREEIVCYRDAWHGAERTAGALALERVALRAENETLRAALPIVRAAGDLVAWFNAPRGIGCGERFQAAGLARNKLIELFDAAQPALLAMSRGEPEPDGVARCSACAAETREIEPATRRCGTCRHWRAGPDENEGPCARGGGPSVRYHLCCPDYEPKLRKDRDDE